MTRAERWLSEAARLMELARRDMARREHGGNDEWHDDEAVIESLGRTSTGGDGESSPSRPTGRELARRIRLKAKRAGK